MAAVAMALDKMTSRHNLWERVCDTVAERCPGKSGIALWDILEPEIVQDGNYDTFFFPKCDDGSWDLTQPILLRHPDQRPSERDTLVTCKASILKVGMHKLGRGAIIAEWGPDGHSLHVRAGARTHANTPLRHRWST